MWIHEDHYKVPVEERLYLESCLKSKYVLHGVYFKVDKTGDFVDYPHQACLSHDTRTKHFDFYCGEFWNEYDNLLPVIAMAHELGHYIDLEQNFDLDLLECIRILGTVEMEVRAWLHAVEIFKGMGFTRWGVFFGYAEYCLSSYFSDPIHIDDFMYGFKGTSPTFDEAKNRMREKIGVTFEKEFMTVDVEIINYLERLGL
jgi:hypothetical protein